MHYIYILLTRRISLFWSMGIDKFWSGGIRTSWVQKIIPAKLTKLTKILKLYQVFMHNFLPKSVLMLPNYITLTH